MAWVDIGARSFHFDFDLIISILHFCFLFEKHISMKLVVNIFELLCFNTYSYREELYTSEQNRMWCSIQLFCEHVKTMRKIVLCYLF